MSEAIGRPVNEIFHIINEKTRQPVESPVARVLREGTVIGLANHTILVSRDGVEIPIADSGAPVCDADGSIRGVVLVFRDQRKERDAEARLRHAEKMEAIGQLASGVAHDFNNQLAGILGYAELLRNRLQDPKLKQFAENICAAAHCAADVTRQLLSFSRKERQVTMPVDMHKIIGDVVNMLEHTIDKRITIRQNLHASPHSVNGDPSQLHTALLNLAVNARDAMPQGGVLTFTTSVVDLPADEATHTPAGKYLRILVSDTGVGMDDRIKSRLFEPFFTTKEHGRGTGLGLAAVHGAVKNHNGRIEVTSAVGKGSDFSLLLPLLESDIRSADAKAATMPAKKEARILIVDDEQLLCDMAAEILREAGYRVTTYKDSDEAIGYYLQSWEHVDLVILDMIMPKRSGRETFVALRKINPKVKVLITSGYSMVDEVRQTMEEGAIGFLQKPFLQSEMLKKVAAALVEQA